jgi:hypothetical protein
MNRPEGEEMAVRRLGRFRTGPVGAGEMLGGHGALAAVGEDAFPGLVVMHHAKADNRQWSGMWLWDPLAYVQAALPARDVPEPGTAFSPATGIAVGYAEVVDA